MRRLALRKDPLHDAARDRIELERDLRLADGDCHSFVVCHRAACSCGALVVHVDLTVLVWLLAFAGVFWSYNSSNRCMRCGWLALLLAGIAFIGVAGFSRWWINEDAGAQRQSNEPLTVHGYPP